MPRSKSPEIRDGPDKNAGAGIRLTRKRTALTFSRVGIRINRPRKSP